MFGRLAEADRRVYFEYDSEFIARGCGEDAQR